MDSDLLAKIAAGELEPEHIGTAYEAMLGLEHRRRFGSHYTPRAMTRSIVRTTLRPVLGENPEPDRILSLTLCDPAMGCGAFLLEACRALADELVRASRRSGVALSVTDARKVVAERCLYGVDKDPKAVELARLSLRLLTQSPESASFLDHLREGDSLIGPGGPASRPFDWEAEFPDVFSSARGGFDCFVGNPPFMRGKSVSTVLGEEVRDWLARHYPGSNASADLSSFFFRRCYSMLKKGGSMGLVATNTIAQGDTRASGLAWICRHGGLIYDATTRAEWPGGAAVVVSIVHIVKEPERPIEKHLDGKHVSHISAFLFHVEGDEDPVSLAENGDKSYQGSIVVGSGFTFDDRVSGATPLAVMRELIARDPRNQERIQPYIGGEELYASPIHEHHRAIINFAQMSQAEAQQWPDLFAIVKEKVEPQRRSLKRPAHRERWWQYGDYRPGLYAAIRDLKRVLACSQVSTHLAFAFQPTDRVFAHTLNIFTIDSMAGFAVLQSRIHEAWARFFGSTLGDGLRYTATTCFETFPFPEMTNALERTGIAYYEARAALMLKHDEGLTVTYNRFHDPEEESSAIVALRALHEKMDRAVMDAYAWTDLPASAHFVRERKSYRYRLPDAIKDEMLARLIALNARRLPFHPRSPSPPSPPKDCDPVSAPDRTR